MKLKEMPRWLQRPIIKLIMKKNGGRTFIFKDNESITCLTCEKTSWSSSDRENLFCLRCGHHEDTMRLHYVPKKDTWAA